MKRIVMLVALCLGSVLGAGGSALAANWALVGAEYNRGPLSCSPPTGQFLDWAKPASGWTGSVKYQGDSRKVVNIASWKQPVFIPSTGEIYMELAAQQLRQNAVSRIYVQRKNPIAMRDGNVIGSAQVRTGKRTDWQTLRIRPWEDSDTYYLEVWFTTGGNCTSYLGRYTFRRR